MFLSTFTLIWNIFETELTLADNLFFRFFFKWRPTAAEVTASYASQSLGIEDF